MKNASTQVIMGFKLYDITEKPKTHLCSDCRLERVEEGETQCPGCKKLIEQRNLYDKPNEPSGCTCGTSFHVKKMV